MRIGLIRETDPCDTQTEMRYVNPLTTTGWYTDTRLQKVIELYELSASLVLYMYG
jgi:hypothetical protein